MLCIMCRRQRVPLAHASRHDNADWLMMAFPETEQLVRPLVTTLTTLFLAVSSALPHTTGTTTEDAQPEGWFADAVFVDSDLPADMGEWEPDGAPDFPDENGRHIEVRDDIDKASSQHGTPVGELYVNAWNQGDIDGHPESDSWFHDETDYVDEMLGKVMSYDSDTDWAATVDTDLCRATFFHREYGIWVPKCGWNSYQGIHRPWQSSEYDGLESETKRNWQGPRSRSFKGAWKITGRWKDGGGVSEWATSIVPCNHEQGINGRDNCQRFEVGYGDATNTPLEKRFKTHGCTGLDTPCAKWVCATIPNGTTVIVFDKVNPWPEWFQGDGSES